MPTSVFLSYSRKDEAAVHQLEADLQRGRVTVWRDAELRGGDPWWQTILEQIRRCDVFVLALSNNGLASKPCRAELAYARDLGLPVLPVQIGPVDSLRTAAVGDLQVIEYRQQSGASGIALFAELEEAAHRRAPLPDPLPPAPSVPFAYLLRLGSEIEKEALTPVEQRDLLGELRTCLETEDDEGVKDDARELLRALRRRPDVTYRHAGEIDELLTAAPARPVSGQPSATQAAPAPQASAPLPTSGPNPSGRTTTAAPTVHDPRVPPPRYGPPPPGGFGFPPPGSFPAPAQAPVPAPASGGSRVPLLVGGAVIVAVLAVGGAVVLTQGGSGGGPGPGPTTTSTTPPGPAPTGTPGDQLLAILPGDVDPASCSPMALAADGDVAAMTCGPALTQPGPLATQFNLYPDAATVDEAFFGDVGQLSVTQLAQDQGQTCPDFLGYGDYNNGTEVRGRVACWVGQDNAAYLMWTENEYAAEALVSIPGGGGDGVRTLWAWWTDAGRAAFGG
jgi:hypothetical protein